MKDFGLTEIPEEVFGLTGLKTLILSNNPLQKIAQEIGSLQSLKTLQMAECNLFDDSLPEEITKLPLEELTLTSNGLTSFDLLTQIPTLKRLNLASNDILTIPSSVLLHLTVDQQFEEFGSVEFIKEQYHRYRRSVEFVE